MKPKLFGDFRDTVARNAVKDPTYAPYCGRCSTMERMRKIETFYWECRHCGAVHDIQDLSEEKK